jgi:hypothetical protein
MLSGKFVADVLRKCGVDVPRNVETPQDLFSFLQEHLEIVTFDDMPIEPKPLPPQKKCYLIYKSLECGYIGENSGCDKSFSDCKRHGNLHNFVADYIPKAVK